MPFTGQRLLIGSECLERVQALKALAAVAAFISEGELSRIKFYQLEGSFPHPALDCLSWYKARMFL